MADRSLNNDDTVYRNKNGKLVNRCGDIWGYVRVSTKEQKLDRQLIALEEYGVDSSHIFADLLSGKNFNRPAYKRLIRIVRKGDIIVIKSIDRLGRNYQDIIDQWRMITVDIGCGIHVVDMPLLNTSGDPDDLISRFVTDMTLQVLSFVAQNERENTINRQKEGIEAARRKRKVKIGRPKKPMPFDFWEIYLMWKTGEYGTNDLWRYCYATWGTSNRTFYRRIHELDVRFGDLSPERLRDLILDDEFLEGIPFDNERLELGIEFYNPYILHNPKKESERKIRKKVEGWGDDEEAASKQEAELMAEILKKRQQEFRDKFGIPDDEGMQLPLDMREKMPTRLIRCRKPTSPDFRHVVSNHKRNSGMDQAVSLEEKPLIPDVSDRIEPQKPVKTVIIL